MTDMTVNAKASLRTGYRALRKWAPSWFFLIQYRRAADKLGDYAQVRQRLFNDLIKNSENLKCLQIGVKDDYGRKYGDSWISVDRFDTRSFIDYNYDIYDLKFADGEFDVVVCISVLEHIAEPQRALMELGRVLKPQGRIWVQLPFNYPYHEGPNDYWRASPGGLRMWMHGYEEISCGAFRFTRSSLATSSYFYGEKRGLGDSEGTEAATSA